MPIVGGKPVATSWKRMQWNLGSQSQRDSRKLSNLCRFTQPWALHTLKAHSSRGHRLCCLPRGLSILHGNLFSTRGLDHLRSLAAANDWYLFQGVGGRKRLPKFKFSAKFPIGLHVILQIQIRKFKNDCYIMCKIILTENTSRFNVEPLLYSNTQGGAGHDCINLNFQQNFP